MLSPLAAAGKDSRWFAVNGGVEPGIPSDTNARLTASVGRTAGRDTTRAPGRDLPDEERTVTPSWVLERD